MEEVPDEYWNSEVPKKYWRRPRLRLLLPIALSVLLAAGAGAWAVTVGPLGHHSQPSGMVFSPTGSSNASNAQPAWASITPPPESEPVSSAPAPSTPASSAPATSVSASTVSKRPAADTGTCAGESTWTTDPKAQYVNAYLPNRVVVGATNSHRCDTLWIFSLGKVPRSMLNAHFGYRIQYVSQALTDIPGRTGSPVKVNGRYILWLQVNAPAAGYEAGAPASEGRFRPGDHMTNAGELKKYFTQIRDMVFLGSDQRTSYYAFGLDTKEPFTLWIHLNSRRQVEWALKIAHKLPVPSGAVPAGAAP